MSRVGSAMVCLINVQREASGLTALRRDARLDASSLFHARDMVGYHYLAHGREGGPILRTRMRATGYFDRVAGGLYTENVGVGPEVNATAAAMVDAWMKSEHHRVNIMRPEFRDMGVGGVMAPPDPAFYEDWPSVVYATDFGRRYYSAPVPACFQTRSSDPATPRTMCTRRSYRKPKPRRHKRKRAVRR
jgi:uncharacterized protein YkwD